jgi:uncharacterized membrane protein YGL010W
MNTKLIQLIQNYRAYHTKKATLYTHMLGIPLVTFSLMILCGWLKLGVPGWFILSFAWVGTVALAIYYFWLDRVIGAVASVILFSLCGVANVLTSVGPDRLSVRLFLVSFVAGWVLQLVGHFIEGRKPALVDNFFESIFIAPFFITIEILGLLGFKKILSKRLPNNP